MARFIRVVVLFILISMSQGQQINKYPKLKETFERNELLEHLLNKVDHLEVKVQQQDQLLQAFQQQQNRSKQTALPELRNTYPRSCYEIAADPTKPSGNYMIDPDGQDVGEDPITVICNMAVGGSTLISHDSEAEIEAAHCATEKCYNRTINYPSATLNQMIALIDISGMCRQSIKYDCLKAPLEAKGKVYSVWNGRNGITDQHFWAGNKATNEHICQCGLDGSCNIPNSKCNCDAQGSTRLIDSGMISVKELLPITKLYFGGMTSTSVAKHTVGKLECSGRSMTDGMPKSCRQLWLMGHTLSGFYTVMDEENKVLKSVFCDMTRPNEAEGMIQIGYEDIKKNPIHFTVQTKQKLGPGPTTIIYESDMLSIGGGMDISTGKFTAPVAGIYHFSFSVLKPKSSIDTTVSLQSNGNEVITKSSNPDKTNKVDSMLAGSVTLKLELGSQVSLYLNSGSIGDDAGAGPYTTFSGALLEQTALSFDN
jgi:hypothetical protein